MGLSIGKVTIDYLRDQSYPDGAALEFIQHVREDCYDAWRVEDEGHVFLEIYREHADVLVDAFAQQKNYTAEQIAEVGAWLDILFGDEDPVMFHTS